MLQELGLVEAPVAEPTRALQASDVQVPDAVLAELQATKKQPVHEDPIQESMERAMNLARQEAFLQNTHAARLSAFFFGDQPKLQASKEVIAKVTTVPSDHVETTLSLLSDILVRLERQYHANRMQALIKSDCKLILFCDITRFDETPMLVSHRPAGPQVLGHGAGHRSSRQGLLHAKAASPCKMLCTEQRYGALVRCTVEGEHGLTEEHCILTGTVLCWNQLLERTTGLCQFQALTEAAFVDPTVEAFP